MAKKKDDLPQLPEAELDVLSCLLQHGHMTARAIREALEQARPMAHASVVTLLNRLEQKELVRKQKGKTGKAFVYQATRKPGSVYRSLVQGLLDRVFAGNGLAMMQSLFETKPPNKEELDTLQSMLDDMRGAKK
jgi:BlaI family transcriptional regulator, penicillinase repressor